jgi:hypothetical protein
MDTFSFTTSLVIVFVGLGLAFLGRKVVKILVFVGAGLVGAKIAHSLLSDLGQPLTLLAAVVAFLVLGFLSLMVLKFIFGVMLGIAGYLVFAALSSQVLGILAGIVIFVVGLVLFKYYLSVATAFGGGVLIFAGLEDMGLFPLGSVLVAIVVGILGAYYQFKQLHE